MAKKVKEAAEDAVETVKNWVSLSGGKDGVKTSNQVAKKKDLSEDDDKQDNSENNDNGKAIKSHDHGMLELDKLECEEQIALVNLDKEYHVKALMIEFEFDAKKKEVEYEYRRKSLDVQLQINDLELKKLVQEEAPQENIAKDSKDTSGNVMRKVDRGHRGIERKTLEKKKLGVQEKMDLLDLDKEYQVKIDELLFVYDTKKVEVQCEYGRKFWLIMLEMVEIELELMRGLFFCG